MLLADANGPIVTPESAPIGATGFGTTIATPSPYVYDGILPTEKGFNWWIIAAIFAIMIVILAIVRIVKK